MRIGFLFNHDQTHQVAHGLPIALALGRRRGDLEIVLATTGSMLEGEVARVAKGHLGGNISLRSLRLTRRLSRAITALARRIAPAAKLLVYRDNLEFFRSLDVLVVPEKTSLILKSRYRLDDLTIVHTRHGAGDRAIGFDRASAAFDHILVSGPKVRDRLVAEAGTDPGRISIVGYPKFDLYADEPSGWLERDERPIVLYNPHPSPHLSSWYRMGRAILDWFVAHDEYRLIFAPHVMLFERRLAFSLDKLRVARPGRLARRHRHAPNIIVDPGSRRSTTMAYTNAADIYLGDASSQVYEFLIRPRPCVFADAHRTAWQGNRNFAHWTAGPVFGDVADLGAALDRARRCHAARYRPIQEALFAETFDLTDVPSSQRAADEVARIADRRRDPPAGSARGQGDRDHGAPAGK